MTTTQKTNEEIADKCIFRAYSEHTPERKDKMLREKLVEALNTKDREKDEAVAEVKRYYEACPQCTGLRDEAVVEAVKRITKTIRRKLHEWDAHYNLQHFDRTFSHSSGMAVGHSAATKSFLNLINGIESGAPLDELEALTTPNLKDHE